MTSSVIIRDIKWGDFEQLVKNYFSYHDELNENPNLGILVGGKKPKLIDEIDWFAAFYKRLLKGDAVASVAEVDGKVVGLCDINRWVLAEDVRHRGELGIAILKEYRGRGIGTKLIKSTIKKAKGKFGIVWLGAFATNKDAVKLYEKCGFKKYGFAKKFFKRKNHYIDEYFLYMKL